MTFWKTASFVHTRTSLFIFFVAAPVLLFYCVQARFVGACLYVVYGMLFQTPPQLNCHPFCTVPSEHKICGNIRAHNEHATHANKHQQRPTQPTMVSFNAQFSITFANTRDKRKANGTARGPFVPGNYEREGWVGGWLELAHRCEAWTTQPRSDMVVISQPIPLRSEKSLAVLTSGAECDVREAKKRRRVSETRSSEEAAAKHLCFSRKM